MSEVEQMPLEKPLFGKYEVGRLLGCGAFAKVYHASDIRTGQSIAVKVMSKKKIAGNSLTENVKREISIMSRLRHPNIVKLIEVLATKTKIFFVMEFVKCGELFDKITKGRFSEELARKIFQQLITAVGYCHSRGVFHRDLKPENLLIDENGDLKVSDFGLSAVTGQIQNDGLLHTLCGTPAYVAPEILSNKGYDGAKFDVWSCGVVLFVMTAGYLPFNEANLMVMYKKIYRGDFRCPKWMSVDLRLFLSRLLQTNPDNRITIDEILRDPWFKNGNEEIKFHDEFLDPKSDKEEQSKIVNLNAFDLISFSAGLDLSGLFDDSYNVVDDSERFVSGDSPERIIEKLEEIAEAENFRIKKKEWAVVIEGLNGRFSVGVEISRLTDDLIVCEVRRKGGDAMVYSEMWKNKFKPEMSNFISKS